MPVVEYGKVRFIFREFARNPLDVALKDQSKADAMVAIGKRATDEIKMTGAPTFVIDGKVYGGELSLRARTLRRRRQGVRRRRPSVQLAGQVGGSLTCPHCATFSRDGLCRAEEGLHRHRSSTSRLSR